MMRRVGFHKARPVLKQRINRFYPNIVFQYLRNGISFFIIYFFIVFILSDCDSLGQQVGCSFDTIQLIKNNQEHHSNYLPGTKISKCNIRANTYRVSLQINYTALRSKDGILSSVSLGPLSSKECKWQLIGNIANEEIVQTFKIDLFCPEMDDQVWRRQPDPTPTFSKGPFSSEFDFGPQSPVLVWGKASSGLIQMQDGQIVQFCLIFNEKERPDIYRKLKEQNTDFTFKRRKDFILYGIWSGNENMIVYNSQKNLISLFRNKNLIGNFQPDEHKLFCREQNKNPFILAEKTLHEDDRINLIIMSVFCQWFVCLI